MKGYACLLLTLSLAVLGEGLLLGILFPNKSVCPKGSKDPVLIPHEKCSQYYVCAAGQEAVMQCPPGQHFNKELQICDRPDKAGCEVKPTPSDDSTKWSVVDLRSQAKDAPFSLSALIPSNAIKANNLTSDAALKTIHDYWVKRQEEKLESSYLLYQGSDELKGLGKRSVHVRPVHPIQPLQQGTYPRGTYETQQQANNRIFHDIEARLGARPATYPSGPHHQGKFRRYLY